MVWNLEPDDVLEPREIDLCCCANCHATEETCECEDFEPETVGGWKCRYCGKEGRNDDYSWENHECEPGDFDYWHEDLD